MGRAGWYDTLPLVLRASPLASPPRTRMHGKRCYHHTEMEQRGGDADSSPASTAGFAGCDKVREAGPSPVGPSKRWGK